jgi:hypothetical protein
MSKPGSARISSIASLTFLPEAGLQISDCLAQAFVSDASFALIVESLIKFHVSIGQMAFSLRSSAENRLFWLCG